MMQITASTQQLELDHTHREYTSVLPGSGNRLFKLETPVISHWGVLVYIW